MLAALEKHSGPPVMIRGRVITFKHYLNTWHFNLQPGYVTWDRPSNVHSWVRFDKLRLVLADKAKVDEIRAAQMSAVPVLPPASPPPPSPPPSPARPTAPSFAGIGDESDSDDGRPPPRRAPPPQPVIGDDSEDNDWSAHPAGAARAGQKRPRDPLVHGDALPTAGDQRDGDACAAPLRAQLPLGLARPPGAVDDELGSQDDDLAEEEVATLLDDRSFADVPCVRALYTKAAHKAGNYKFDLNLGMLTESSRVHMFREGKCELEFVDAPAYDEKLRRMGMLS